VAVLAAQAHENRFLRFNASTTIFVIRPCCATERNSTLTKCTLPDTMLQFAGCRGLVTPASCAQLLLANSPATTLVAVALATSQVMQIV
jgi:hypothetical protein